MKERIAVTGSSGFIGYHTAQKLLDQGNEVVGIDNENDYYDPKLKERRRNKLLEHDNFSFHQVDIETQEQLNKVFEEDPIDKVCHLAAQAGVRYSLENPDAYIQTNLVGFHNMIKLAEVHEVDNFVYASSSSVYGMNEKQPFSVTDRVDTPVSLYAATKKSNELIAYTYSHLYDLPTIGLRFFTVYGPAGRPDMAYYKFADLITSGKPIDVYNHGKMQRDFTYIDDIVDGIVKALDYKTDYALFNLGNDTPEELMDMIHYLEDALGQEAEKNFMEMQPGDVPITRADLTETKQALNREPTTPLNEGLTKFVERYDHYNQR